MKKINAILLILMASVVMMNTNSCKKDDANTSPVNIRLTDAPGPYNAVFIDLQGVELTGNDGKAIMLGVNAGIYNLLNFSNGYDTLIASGSLEVTTVQQIRLILGTDNSVVVNDVSYPLSTPSADQSGLKLQIHKTLEAGVLYSVLLDFDANKSIIEEGNGNYKLKPVIRTIETAISGSIKGKITPVGELAVVTAATDISYSTNVNLTGDFLLGGLPEGMYTLTITPALPLNPVSLDSIVVTTGVTTNVGTIAF